MYMRLILYMYIFKEVLEYIIIYVKRENMIDFHEQVRFYLEKQKQWIAD